MKDKMERKPVGLVRISPQARRPARIYSICHLQIFPAAIFCIACACYAIIGRIDIVISRVGRSLEESAVPLLLLDAVRLFP